MCYILYDSNYIPFWKKQKNYGDSKVISGCQQFQGRQGGMDRQNRRFLGQLKCSVCFYFLLIFNNLVAFKN